MQHLCMSNRSGVCHVLTLLSLSCLCILPEACSFVVECTAAAVRRLHQGGRSQPPSYVHQDAEGVKTAYSLMDIQ